MSGIGKAIIKRTVAAECLQTLGAFREWEGLAEDLQQWLSMQFVWDDRIVVDICYSAAGGHLIRMSLVGMMGKLSYITIDLFKDRGWNSYKKNVIAGFDQLVRTAMFEVIG